MTRWYDTDGGPTCGDCFHGCPRPPHWEACDRDGCRCPCRTGEGVDPVRLPTLDECRKRRPRHARATNRRTISNPQEGETEIAGQASITPV